jgi:translation elongation factor EF-Ts
MSISAEMVKKLREQTGAGAPIANLLLQVRPDDVDQVLRCRSSF